MRGEHLGMVSSCPCLDIVDKPEKHYLLELQLMNQQTFCHIFTRFPSRRGFIRSGPNVIKLFTSVIY
jgi:hypothetical protein